MCTCHLPYKFVIPVLRYYLRGTWKSFPKTEWFRCGCETLGPAMVCSNSCFISAMFALKHGERLTWRKHILFGCDSHSDCGILGEAGAGLAYYWESTVVKVDLPPFHHNNIYVVNERLVFGVVIQWGLGHSANTSVISRWQAGCSKSRN